MLRLLLAALCGFFVASHAPATCPAPSIRLEIQGGKGGKPLKALAAWLKLYHRGKINYRSKDIPKKSVAIKFKVRDKSDLGSATWSGDLKLIAAALSKNNDAASARALAELASVGLDKGKYTYEMAPYEVRLVALEAIAKMSSKAVKEELAVGARGEWNDKKHNAALRAAALLGLGYMGDPDYEPVIAAALADGNSVTRIHAIQALHRIGNEAATMSLINVVAREQNDSVLVTAAKALREIYGDYLRGLSKPSSVDEAGKDDKSDAKQEGADIVSDEKPPATARLAVRAAIQALGRTSWRADMVLVRLLDDFRSNEALPALIAVLERFRDNPDDVKDGKLSGLLQVQVHELLVKMTGAVFPANQPDKWRELWERDKGKIQVAQKRQHVGPGKTMAAGFVGIPVQGTRVVFILDLSGSMDFAMKDSKEKRLDYAKRELMKAVDGLAESTMFNLVTFNGAEHAESWVKELVVANAKNKKRFHKYVDKLRPLGGTNLWSGLESALNVKLLEFGSNYETTIDEIFLLSDGAPSVGEVTDSIEILRLVREINKFKQVRINTVFIHSPAPPRQRAAERELSLSPAELMKRMARENGGKFKDA